MGMDEAQRIVKAPYRMVHAMKRKGLWHQGMDEVQRTVKAPYRMVHAMKGKALWLQGLDEVQHTDAVQHCTMLEEGWGEEEDGWEKRK